MRTRSIPVCRLGRIPVDTVLSRISRLLYLHASSSLKEISKVVALKNKYGGQTPSKSSFIEEFYAQFIQLRFYNTEYLRGMKMN